MRDFAYVSMRRFEYLDPSTVEETVELLGAHATDARILAGGQSLLVLMRQRKVNPPVLVDVKRVEGLRGIENGSGLTIGATTTLAELAASSAVASVTPRLVTVAAQIGSFHIRNRGTIGGTVCFADPAFDLVPLLAALDASGLVVGRGTSREIPVESVARDAYEAGLEPDELLTGIRVPPPGATRLVGFANLRRRGGEFPICQAAASIELVDGVVESAKIVAGGAGPIPLRLARSEETLIGTRLEAAAVEQAGALAEADARPAGDIRGGSEWRKAVVGVVVKRALADATREAAGPE